MYHLTNGIIKTTNKHDAQYEKYIFDIGDKMK